MPRPPETIVIVGTGGTIAGSATTEGSHLEYRAGALSVQSLVDALPQLTGMPLEVQTLAQLDSSDMDHATWSALGLHLTAQLARPEVKGLVVTHGTDTLEETAYFVHRTVAAGKPVVFTAAMRPATAPSADGPQNLIDALMVAGVDGARGVLAVLAGRVHAGAELRKLHGYRVDAFSSGDAGALAVIEDGNVRPFRPWPESQPAHATTLAIDPAHWPWVEIVTSHAGASGELIRQLATAGVAGIVIAGTGNGSVHIALREAASWAQQQGVVVWRSTRCLLGGVVGGAADALHSAGALTPAQARVELMLSLARPAAP